MRSARAIAMSTVLLASAAFGAQQSGDLVSFGGLRVPACPVAADPEYGLVKEKAIPIGGGPLYMDARQRRYLSLLRGPKGQEIRVVGGVGSSPLDLTGNDNTTIIDHYSVVYDGPNGPVTTSIFMDAYHLAAPKVPAGFTCGGPLASGVRMPPVDPIKAGPSTIALAIQLGSKSDIQLPRLDPAAPRGYVLDQFAMIALRARAAATSGSPLDPARPPKDLEPVGITVLAYPVTCGGRTVAPQSIDMTGTQGPVPRRTAGEVLRDEIANVFPGVDAPAGSIAIRFRQAQPTKIQITYVEACDGGPAAVTLPVTIEPAKLTQSSLATLPPGIVEADPTVYLQAVIDPEGRFARPEYLGGPNSLLPTALETIGQWRATPLRVNGTPSIFPVVLQVIFRPN